jgi:hypothetical protein
MHNLLYIRTYYSAEMIYKRVEENPRASARGPEVGSLQHRQYVCCGRRHPAWKVCEDIDYFSLTIVHSYHLVYYRLALDDGVVDRSSYARWHTSTSTSSSTRSSRAANSTMEERDKRRDKMLQNLMHIHQHILGILYVRVSYMLNLSNSIW